MRDWIVTFGGGHEHPLTGEPLRDCYVRVPAETYRDAHDLMLASVFGRQWAFVYEYGDDDELPDGVRPGIGRSAGVNRYKLREVPFIAPSEMAVRLLADEVARAESRLSGDRWVDLVVQPAELELQRAIAAHAIDPAVTL